MPQNGVNGSLGLELVNGSSTFPIHSVASSGEENGGHPLVGVGGLLRFNSSAVLDLTILGSVRNIRDYVEGGGVLTPAIQDGVQYQALPDGTVVIGRIWLDNETATVLVFTTGDNETTMPSVVQNGNQSTVNFDAGTYLFSAAFNYPQLTQLNDSAVLNAESQALIPQQPDPTTSLSFLSYSDKLLAGAWRFLTYFGRDSMIFLLLTQPVLSDQAIEAVIAAVLERINGTTGAVCHEETIGDYATYQNLQMGISNSTPSCSYIMIDTDYYLPVVLRDYYETSSDRVQALLNQTATTNFGNAGTSYAELAQLNAERIMANAAAFAAPNNQTTANLRHLLADQAVGQWRDSEFGIGGGRIPMDVNTALVPSALRAIASLSAAGFWKDVHPDWSETAASYAQVWEDHTLPFFQVNETTASAKDLVSSYATSSNLTAPSHVEDINSTVTYYALALDGGSNQSQVVKVMNTDTCFRLFMLNTTNDDQLTTLLASTADNILQTFPVGLSTDTGLLVANPAYGGDPAYAANFTRSAYHGTVIWGWPMAMMAKGLERQLDRCNTPASGRLLERQTNTTSPAWCNDEGVYIRVKQAYNHLWDLIEGNEAHLTSELWGWQYVDGQGFEFVDYGVLSATESDIRQLWSLAYLAVTRNEALR